jgi:hypothetical protein
MEIGLNQAIHVPGIFLRMKKINKKYQVVVTGPVPASLLAPAFLCWPLFLWGHGLSAGLGTVSPTTVHADTHVCTRAHWPWAQ